MSALSAAALALTPLAYYKMDEASGNIADATGNNDGSGHDNHMVSSASCTYRQATHTGFGILMPINDIHPICFPGSGVSGTPIPLYTALKLTPSITWCGVFKSASAPASDSFLWGANQVFDSGGWCVGCKSNGKLGVQIHGSGLVALSDASICDGVEHFIAVRWNGTNWNGYVDGVKQTATSTSGYDAWFSADNVNCGLWNSNAPHILGDVGVWASALTDANIDTTLYGAYLLGTTPPVNTVPPVVTGTGAVGQVLTTTDGTWTAGGTVTYGWTRDGTPIAAATSSTYTVAADDAGADVGSKVTNTSTNGSTVATSSTHIPIPDAPPSPSGGFTSIQQALNAGWVVLRWKDKDKFWWTELRFDGVGVVGHGLAIFVAYGHATDTAGADAKALVAINSQRYNRYAGADQTQDVT